MSRDWLYLKLIKSASARQFKYLYHSSWFLKMALVFQVCIMSAALLLQVVSLALLPHYSLNFEGSPPATCKYQGYTFQLLHTHLCLNYRLCYCQLAPNQDSHLNPTPPIPPQSRIQRHKYFEYDYTNPTGEDGDVFVTGTTSPPFEEVSATPLRSEGLPLFIEWRPKPAECACWCSGITYEIREDVLYQPEDTCIIDESDCYCDLEKDMLWANQRRRIYEDWSGRDIRLIRVLHLIVTCTIWDTSLNL